MTVVLFNFLLLLDLSAAFDAVKHSTLLSRLQSCYGITGQALAWMESYLCNRKQSVAMNFSIISSSRDLLFGVPQGSVLGPVLFSLYTSPITDIIQSHGLKYHLYADVHSCTWHSIPPVVRTLLQLCHVLKLV